MTEQSSLFSNSDNQITSNVSEIANRINDATGLHSTKDYVGFGGFAATGTFAGVYTGAVSGIPGPAAVKVGLAGLAAATRAMSGYGSLSVHGGGFTEQDAFVLAGTVIGGTVGGVPGGLGGGVIGKIAFDVKEAIRTAPNIPHWYPPYPATSWDDRFGTPFYSGNVECFLAGTPVDMWDGTQKPIEAVAPDDIVTAYDKDGNLAPGKVTRTFQNHVKRILDVHGLMVTPGHVTLCGDGPFKDQHVPMIDILRSDGALVKKDGTLVRAATGCPVGSMGDRLIWAIAGPIKADGKVDIHERRQIRLGTRMIAPDGRDVCLMDYIGASNVMITEDGELTTAPGEPTGAYHWRFTPALPKPEDYVLQRSGLTLDQVYEAGEWEAMGPQVPPPYRGEAGPSFKTERDVLRAGGRRLTAEPNVPVRFQGMNRKQRRAASRKQG